MKEVPIYSIFLRCIVFSILSTSVAVAMTAQPSSVCNNIKLPKNLIVGYANWHQCDDSIVQAVKDGVNVLMWFSVDLGSEDLNGVTAPAVLRGPDMNCVAQCVATMKTLNLNVIHLISIGGWNAPHPETRFSPLEMFTAFDKWNRQVICRPELGFHGFDGFDWDIEGNDTPENSNNQFSVECLDLMGQVSQLAKQKGYIVAVAPAESYLDPTTSEFERSLLHTYPECKVSPPFAYHVRNCYAYLLSRYGSTSVGDETVDTFDFVTVQLYEGYSHANYHIHLKGESVAEYISRLVEDLHQGWDVEFSRDASISWSSRRVRVDRSKLVIGLANGWAGDGKFLFIRPDDVKTAYDYMVSRDAAPRGFAFWNILDEGKEYRGEAVWLAKALSKVLGGAHT